MDTTKLQIKNKTDLKNIVDFLYENGFGYLRDYELHNSKIDSIINKANTLGIKYEPEKLKSSFKHLENYSDIEKEAKQFFSKFNVDDKINEYIDIFYIQSDASYRTPSNRPDTKEVIEWVEFKKKYNLKDEFGASRYVSYYNLDKNYFKIKFGEYESHKFENLYKLIFNENCTEFSQKKYGEWINLGKIEIKFFQNGYANLKGDLKKLKDYYYKYLKRKIYNVYIIKYNGKEEILKSKNDD